MPRKVVMRVGFRIYEEDSDLADLLNQRLAEWVGSKNDLLIALLRQSLEEKASDGSDKSFPDHGAQDLPTELLPLIRRTVAAAVREELNGLTVVQGENPESPEDQGDEDPDATAILDTLDQQLRGEW
jgi:hypothetical protein